jgi:hypothetical protein
MAVFLLAMMVTDRRSATLPYLGVLQSSNLMATLTANPGDWPSYCVTQQPNDRNAWKKASFEWTNGNQALSTAPQSFDMNH